MLYRVWGLRVMGFSGMEFRGYILRELRREMEE